jgi:putative membrane protein
MEPPGSQPSADVPTSTGLAVDRTRMAHERTLMAWVRTSTSLISFGFTIYKFFQYLRESSPTPLTEHFFGPRQFAMLMICIGLVTLVGATIQHRRDMKALRAHYAEVPYSLATVLAVLVSFLGIAGLLAAIFRQ